MARRVCTVALRPHLSVWVPVLQIVLGALVLAVSAQVKIPLPGTPVPATLQSIAVLLIGMMLSSYTAIGASALYVSFGMAGLPVFAAGSAGLFGPTGGYLVGFVLTAGVTAWVRGNDRTAMTRLILAGAIGLAVLFLCGVTWLAFWIGSLKAAIIAGLLPFAAKGVVELLLAASAVRCLSELQDVRRRNS